MDPAVLCIEGPRVFAMGLAPQPVHFHGHCARVFYSAGGPRPGDGARLQHHQAGGIAHRLEARQRCPLGEGEREVIQLRLDLDRAPLDPLQLAGGAGFSGPVAGVAELVQRWAQLLQAVLCLLRAQGVAMQLRFALQVGEDQPGKRNDQEGRNREARSGQAPRMPGGHAPVFHGAAKASRAAANVASSSAGPWQADTNPAS